MSEIVKIQRPMTADREMPWLVFSEDRRILLLVPQENFSERVRKAVNLAGRGYFRATVMDGKIVSDRNGILKINTRLEGDFLW
jgi:hypothetical protein